jgi:hypothetical protein
MIRVQHLGVPSLVLMAVFCFSSGAMASGVVASANESSLVAAMTGGGTVTFAVNGTIYLTSTIVVSNDTVLDATGYNVAISGSNAVQIFIVNTNTTLAMTNLTLCDGFIQSFSYGYPLDGCGGAISNAGTLQMTDCTFSNNSCVGINYQYGVAADGEAGAVYNSGMVTALGCVFSGNSAVGGSGGYAGGVIGGAFVNANQATFINCSFSNNIAAGGIGASLTSRG